MRRIVIARPFQFLVCSILINLHKHKHIIICVKSYARSNDEQRCGKESFIFFCVHCTLSISLSVYFTLHNCATNPILFPSLNKIYMNMIASTRCSVPLCENAHLCDFHLLFVNVLYRIGCVCVHCACSRALSLIYAPKVILKSVMRKRKLEYSFLLFFSFFFFFSLAWRCVLSWCLVCLLLSDRPTSNCYHITCLHHFRRSIWSILCDYRRSPPLPMPPPSSHHSFFRSLSFPLSFATRFAR